MDPSIIPIDSKNGNYKLSDLSEGLLKKPMPKGEQVGIGNLNKNYSAIELIPN